MSLEYETLKPGDQTMIAEQLKRPARNLFGIASRCVSGFPEVIVTHPVIFREEFLEIFPTLYWLSCPRLVKEVSRLEGGGAIEEIQGQILADPELKTELVEAHHRYAQKRLALVKKPILDLIKSQHPAQYDVLLHSGVGGSMHPGIKCLHAHLADYLVDRENPVGQLIIKKLADKIDEKCHQCSQYSQK